MVIKEQGQDPILKGGKMGSQFPPAIGAWRERGIAYKQVPLGMQSKGPLVSSVSSIAVIVRFMIILSLY